MKSGVCVACGQDVPSKTMTHGLCHQCRSRSGTGDPKERIRDIKYQAARRDVYFDEAGAAQMSQMLLLPCEYCG